MKQLKEDEATAEDRPCEKNLRKDFIENTVFLSTDAEYEFFCVFMKVLKINAIQRPGAFELYFIQLP